MRPDPNRCTTDLPSRGALLRRAALVAGAVAALLVDSISSSGTSSAEPMPIEVEASATPSTAPPGTSVTVQGAITNFRLTSTDGESVVAACGDVEATACGEFPTGSIAIEVGGTELGTTSLVGEDATFSWSTDELPVGTHDLVAVYPGDDWYPAAESAPMRVTITETVPQEPAPQGSYGDASTTMTATAGGQVTVRGQGWHAESDVTLTMRSEPVVLGVASTDVDGAFSQTSRIPVGTAPGAHTITLSGTDVYGDPATVVLDLTVVAPGGSTSPAATPESLSFTG
jgi:hypothetical protein